MTKDYVQKDNISKSILTSVEKSPENEVSILSIDQSDRENVLDLSRNPLLDPMQELEQIRQKNSNRLIVAQLNINSIRNKFDSLVEMVKENVDILLISETKIDSSFPKVQFHIDGFTTYRRDRNIYGGGILLYVREDIPASLINLFRLWTSSTNLCIFFFT